ncbi:MAG TPA: hypothetical protein VGI28_17650 [Stellaceae bacterium]|jgi:hypothetical protein
MADITLVTLHDELNALRIELRVDLIRLEAKIDSKPSLMAMFTGIVIVVFGMAGVIASTIAILTNLHLLK